MSAQKLSDKDTPRAHGGGYIKAGKDSTGDLTYYRIESFKADKDASVEALAEEIQLRLLGEGVYTVAVFPISKQKALQVREFLREAGCRLKLDWYAELRRAEFRMTSRLHSQALMMFTHDNYHRLATALRAVCTCKMQKLATSGDAKVYLDGPNYLQPDACFTIEEGDKIMGTGYQRVIFESLMSQSLESGVRKAKVYLNSCSDVHIVVLLNFEYPPMIGEKVRRCRATMQIWTRRETGNVELDYPLDGCPWDSEATQGTIEHAQHLLGEPEPEEPQGPEGSGNLPDKSASVGQKEPNKGALDTPLEIGADDGNAEGEEDLAVPELSDFGTEGSTKVEHPEDIPDPLAMSGTVEVVVERRSKPILVFDEMPSDDCPVADYIDFDAYDFIRICGSNPDELIPEEQRTIRLPLAQLQEGIENSLRDERRSLGLLEPRPRPVRPTRRNSNRPAPGRPRPYPSRTAERAADRG